MEINGFFQTPILIKDLNNNLQEIERECVLRSRLSEGRKISNLGGWQSKDVFSDDRFFSDLANQIQNIVIDFAESIEIDLKSNNAIQMWININGYKDSNILHDHPKSIFSGVYYVKVPQNAGNIKFYHPAHSLLERDWANLRVNTYNFYNSHVWSLSPVENRIIVFPSWIDHLVEPNLSHEERISISFNVGVV